MTRLGLLCLAISAMGAAPALAEVGVIRARSDSAQRVDETRTNGSQPHAALRSVGGQPDIRSDFRDGDYRGGYRCEPYHYVSGNRSQYLQQGIHRLYPGHLHGRAGTRGYYYRSNSCRPVYMHRSCR